MALNNYSNFEPKTVIADDNRDPYVSWQNHLNRSGRGGVDLVAAVGTPLIAPTNGTMDWRPNDGSAGNSCRFWHDTNPGWADVFSHLQSYVGTDMQHFKKGETIGYTGNTGGVTQHLHRHLLDPASNRQNPWDYFSTIGTAGTIQPETEAVGEEMARIAIFNIDASSEPNNVGDYSVLCNLDTFEYTRIRGQHQLDTLKAAYALQGNPIEQIPGQISLALISEFVEKVSLIPAPQPVSKHSLITVNSVETHLDNIRSTVADIVGERDQLLQKNVIDQTITIETD